MLDNVFVLNTVNSYRVPTVQDALKLREYLEHSPYVELASFSYTTKFTKEKGEIVEEYQLVKAKIVLNQEKDPMSHINVYYGTEENEGE